MTNLVPADEIEKIAGATRHPVHHLGVADSAEEQVYILHSVACRQLHDDGIRDVRGCDFSRALDRGIDVGDWDEGVPCRLDIVDGHLVGARCCRQCGCTDAEACIGGCYWIESDLCSGCRP